MTEKECVKISYCKCFLFSLLLSVSGCAFCSGDNYQNFLWTPSIPSSISNATSVTIDDSAVSQVSITFPEVHSWKALSTSCSGHWDGEQKGNYRYWLQYRTTWQTSSEGLVYRFNNVSNWSLAQSIPVSGVNTMVSTNAYYEQRMSACWYTGQVVNFTPPMATPVFLANIELKRSSASPGHYTIRVPYWWGYEENKSSGYNEAIAWRQFGIAMQNEEPSYIELPVVVTSKCSFNTSPINLSYGTMSGREADGKQTKPYMLNISCKPGTSLSARLWGMQKVSGKTSNYTRCGDGGICELTFGDGGSSETMTIDTNKILSIKSTYHLNDITNPVAESFEGSGVLQVIIN